MLKIRVTAGKGFSLPQGGESLSINLHAIWRMLMMIRGQSLSPDRFNQHSTPTHPSHPPSPPPPESPPTHEATATLSSGSSSGGSPTSSSSLTRTRSVQPRMDVFGHVRRQSYQ
jgi:hypothetical protein